MRSRRGLFWLVIAVVLVLVLSVFFVGNPPRSVLVYAFSSDAVNMDPLEAADITSWKVMSQIYEGLMKFKPGSLEVEPCLASHYDVSDDGLVYTFYLQKNVLFHDGTPFDADAVVWNARRGMERVNTSYYANLVWGNVKEVKKLSQYVVRFELKKADADFPSNLALPFGGSMVSPNGANLSEQPVGTGPYRLTNWEKNKEITLQYNRSWWQRGITNGAGFKTIRYVVIEDMDQAVSLLKRGKVHILDNVPADKIHILENDAAVSLVQTPLMATSFLGFNTKSPVFIDPKVRQALVLLLDQDSLITYAYDGFAMRSNGPLPPVLEKEVGCRYLSGNKQLGMKLLREAGYSEENPLAFTVEVPLEPRDYLPSGGVKLGENLKRVYEGTGLVKVTFVYKPFERVFNELRHGEVVEAFVLGWSSDNGQVDNMLTPLFHSKSPLNFFKYDRPMVDKYLEEAQKELDQEKKMELYRKVCEILLEDPPAAFLPHAISYRAVHGRLKGYNVNPINIEQLYFVHY